MRQLSPMASPKVSSQIKVNARSSRSSDSRQEIYKKMLKKRTKADDPRTIDLQNMI